MEICRVESAITIHSEVILIQSIDINDSFSNTSVIKH